MSEAPFSVTIIAERGLFVRLLVESGKFATPHAEELADALDAATREPATKGELLEAKAELKADIADLKADVAMLGQRLDQIARRLDARIDSIVEKLVVRLGGLMIALFGLAVAASRLSKP